MIKNDDSYSASPEPTAEALLKKNPSKTGLPLSEAESLKLIHELEALRIELKQQKEESRLAKAQAESALKESEKRLNGIIFSLADWVWEIDENGVYTYSSEKGFEFFGPEREDIIGKTPFDFMPPDEAKRVASIFSEIAANKAPIKDLENWNIDKNGKRICLLTNGVPILDEAGNLKGYRGVDKDITERTKTEKLLKARNDLFLNLAEKIPGYIAYINANTLQYVFANDLFAKLYGIPKEKIIGSHIKEIIGEANYQFISKYIDEVKQGKSVSYDNTLDTVAGKRWLHVNYTPVLDDGGQVASIVVLSYDFTKRKLAEEALTENERFLRESQAVARLGSFKWDLSTGLWKSSDILDEIFGIDENYIRSFDGWTNIVHPEWRKIMIDFVTNEVLGKHQPFDKEYQIIRQVDGQELWVHGLAKLEMDNNNQPIKLIGTISDITEHKNSESELRLQSEILSQINEAVYMVRMKDGIIVYTNSRFEEMFGYKQGEMLGKYVSILNAPTEKSPEETAKEILGSLADNGYWNGEVYNIKKDGTPFWSHAKVSVFDHSQFGEVLVDVHEDITERKRAEEALIKSNRQYDKLVAKIPVGVYVLHSKPDGAFVLDYVSPKMAEIFNLSVESLLADANLVPQSIHPDDRHSFEELNQEGIRLRRPFNWKGRMLVDGKEKWLHISSIPELQESGDILWHGLTIDITERMQAETEILLKSEELSILVAEKDKFFSIIAHDLRGPLGSLLGLTEVLADASISFSPVQQQELMSELNNSARNTFSLLENLLEWSRMQRGLILFNIQMLDLMNVVNDCIKIVIESARDKAIDIAVDVPCGLKVLADTNMLQTVIRNLVSNAIKFTPHGGRVTITALPGENNMTVIAVKDTGIGMTGEMLDNLFKIDVKSGRRGTEGEPSSGLGLVLCKEFIVKQGGKIWVESEEGKGSVFYFSLPYNGEAEEKINKIDVVSVKAEEDKAVYLKILIAEDDEVSGILIPKLVKIFSKEILKVTSGTEAVETCRNHPDIDLVLMDIKMPGISGYEATRQIRQFNKEVIIIAQTAFASSEDKIRATAAGCNDHISKPIMKDILTELINKHFIKAGKESEIFSDLV